MRGCGTEPAGSSAAAAFTAAADITLCAHVFCGILSASMPVVLHQSSTRPDCTNYISPDTRAELSEF